MTIAEMLSQSGTLTLLGMGVVFAFLIIMIFAMILLHSILHALKLDVEKKDESNAPPAPPAVDNGAVAAAVAVALKEKNSL